MTITSDAILARLMALHPKKIDLSLERIEALLAKARQSDADVAAQAAQASSR